MKKTWLLNFENQHRTSKLSKSKKIRVKPKQSKGEDQSREDNAEDQSCGSTTSTVVSMIADKELSRGKKLLGFLKKRDTTQCGAGSPSGHIARQLNRPNPISLNIDRSSTKPMYNFSSHASSMLSFSQKPALDVISESVWDRRIYPSVPLFENMTPRDGVSKRKSVHQKPRVHRDFVVRQSVADSMVVVTDGKVEDANLIHGHHSANFLDNMLDELRIIGSSISLSDLAGMAALKSPPAYVGAIFTYLYVLIMGTMPAEDVKKAQHVPHDSRSPNKTEPDARKILLRETGSILQYIQHIHPANIPADHLTKAIDYFKSHIAIFPGHEIERLSRAFTKLVQWAVVMNKICQVLAHADEVIQLEQDKESNKLTNDSTQISAKQERATQDLRAEPYGNDEVQLQDIES